MSCTLAMLMTTKGVLDVCCFAVIGHSIAWLLWIVTGGDYTSQGPFYWADSSLGMDNG